MRNHFLPLELIREILLRLPVRSVLRFKCVCKSWFSLISDPQFGISHFDLAASPTHRILRRSNDSYAQSIDVEAPLNNFAAVHLPLPPPAHFDTYGAFHDTHEILGSCRGLILLFYGKTSDLILWNPSIGVHKRFPDFDYNLIDGYLHGFGYDISTDDYLLILVENFDCSHALPEIKIFSFKTNSWNRVGVNVQYIHADDDEFQAGTLVNGALHWLVYSYHIVEHDDPPSVFDEYVPVIIAFDLIQRTLSEIPLLHPLTNGKYELYSLAVMGGCLSVCCSVQGRRTTEIWVMKEYKVESSWTKSIVIPTCGDYYCDRFSPICITKDGGIFGSNIIGRLEKRNDMGELLESLSYGQGRRVLYEDNLQSAMYRESLLPLPVSSGETSEYDQQ